MDAGRVERRRRHRTVTALVALAICLTGALAVSPTPGEALLEQRTISSGTADNSNVLGPRWRKVPFTARATGTATFRLTWTGTGSLRFQILRADGTIIGGNITTSGSPKTANVALVNGTAYSATIWSASGVGVYTFTVTENVPDTAAPSVPAGLRTTAVSTTSVDLAWNASSDNDSVARYDVYRNGVLAGSSSTPAFTDAGLDPATTYTYTVRAADPTGNTSAASAPLDVATLDAGPPDATPPSVPAGLRTTAITAGSVSLAWDPSTDDRAVAGYRILVGGVAVGQSVGPGFQLGGLTASTDYEVSVLAFDAAGNTSDPSAPLVVTTAEAPARAPNIIVINTDDQRADTLQDLPKIRQWLADGGTTFTNGYVSTPSCCPSRATLMSGRYVHNNTQYGQETLGFDVSLTIQRWLHDAGYFTGHSGKFLQWWPLSQVAPHWDRWTYFKGGYTNVWMRFDNVTRQSSGYSTTITFDRALEYLDDFEARNDDTPFFLQLTPIAPHSPTTPEAKYSTAAVSPFVTTPAHTETDRSDKPPFVRNRTTSLTSAQNTRTQMIRTLYSVDDQVDRLMQRLQALGELDDTLVIFTSDNGYLWGEHSLNSKFLPYTESVRVPFVVRWPGHVPAGVVDDRWVTHADIAPTVLAAAGVAQANVQFDGHDILSGYDRPVALTEYYYDTANGNTIPTWAAIETDTYLYVEYYSTTLDRTTPTYREYYDKTVDPYLLQNLLGDTSTANDPDVATLAATLASAKNCAGASCP